MKCSLADTPGTVKKNPVKLEFVPKDPTTKISSTFTEDSSTEKNPTTSAQGRSSGLALLNNNKVSHRESS